MKEKEMFLLSHFRNNSRISLTKLSKITKIPVSTLFDKLKDYERKNLILKNTALLDFKQMGYEIRNQILIGVSKLKKDELQVFLLKHPNVNSLYRINNGFDFLVETIFRNLADMDSFMRQLENFEVQQKKEFFVMEDLKREEFLNTKTIYELA